MFAAHNVLKTRVIPVTYATWNPSDKASGISLSNGNLSAASTSSGNLAVRATIGKSSGKWYWEVKRTDANLIRSEIGVMTSSGNLSSYVGADNYGYAYYSNQNSAKYKIHDGSLNSYGTDYKQTEWVGVALDLDSGTIEFFVNGVSQGQAYTGVHAGTYFPAVSLLFSDPNSSAVTANFGATAFYGSVPSGFNSGVYE